MTLSSFPELSYFREYLVASKIFRNFLETNLLQKIVRTVWNVWKAEYSVTVTFSEVSVTAGDGYLWARIVGSCIPSDLNGNM